jgi:Na+-transporting NADH:ubiquinone oxidoreductase subunit NqrF
MIHDEAQRLYEPVFFLSGPPAMIFAFKKYFSDSGIKAENITIDDWE